MPKKPTWDLKKIRQGLEDFYNKHSRYPTASEFDEFDELPSTRQIQRRFGGLVQLRKDLGIKGQNDLTTGQHSRKRALEINFRAHKLEDEVYKYLLDLFGKEFVHREFFFTDDHRSRTDFLIYYKKGQFSVDVFYASSRHNLVGCLNSKLRKYDPSHVLNYPVIFLQMNENISENEMSEIVKNKKNKLHKNQHLMSMNQLREFCKDMKPNRLK